MSSSKEKIAELVSEYNSEIEKFEKGNNAAGTRARKALHGLTALAKQERAYIQEVKNSKK